MVLIIGILSAIALPQYTQAVEKSRAAEALTNLSSFGKAVKIWKLGHPDVNSCRGFTGNSYGVGELDIDIPDDWVQATRDMISTGPVDSKSCSKNFCYVIDNCLDLKAHRANSSTYKYVIGYDIDDNTYWCEGVNDASKKVCKSLGNMLYIGTATDNDY